MEHISKLSIVMLSAVLLVGLAGNAAQAATSSSGGCSGTPCGTASCGDLKMVGAGGSNGGGAWASAHGLTSSEAQGSHSASAEASAAGFGSAHGRGQNVDGLSKSAGCSIGENATSNGPIGCIADDRIVQSLSLHGALFELPGGALLAYDAEQHLAAFLPADGIFSGAVRTIPMLQAPPLGVPVGATLSLDIVDGEREDACLVALW